MVRDNIPLGHTSLLRGEAGARSVAGIREEVAHADVECRSRPAWPGM